MKFVDEYRDPIAARHLVARIDDLAGDGHYKFMLSDAEESKERLGTIAYVGAAVRETRKRKMFEASVTVDGDVFYKGPASCVLIGNTGSLKGGIDAFPDASSTDGRLHVAVVSATGMLVPDGRTHPKSAERRPRPALHGQCCHQGLRRDGRG